MIQQAKVQSIILVSYTCLSILQLFIYNMHFPYVFKLTYYTQELENNFLSG